MAHLSHAKRNFRRLVRKVIGRNRRDKQLPGEVPETPSRGPTQPPASETKLPRQKSYLLSRVPKQRRPEKNRTPPTRKKWNTTNEVPDVLAQAELAGNSFYHRTNKFSRPNFYTRFRSYNVDESAVSPLNQILAATKSSNLSEHDANAVASSPDDDLDDATSDEEKANLHDLNASAMFGLALVDFCKEHKMKDDLRNYARDSEDNANNPQLTGQNDAHPSEQCDQNDLNESLVGRYFQEILRSVGPQPCDDSDFTITSQSQLSHPAAEEKEEKQFKVEISSEPPEFSFWEDQKEWDKKAGITTKARAAWGQGVKKILAKASSNNEPEKGIRRLTPNRMVGRKRMTQKMTDLAPILRSVDQQLVNYSQGLRPLSEKIGRAQQASKLDYGRIFSHCRTGEDFRRACREAGIPVEDFLPGLTKDSTSTDAKCKNLRSRLLRYLQRKAEANHSAVGTKLILDSEASVPTSDVDVFLLENVLGENQIIQSSTSLCGQPKFQNVEFEDWMKKSVNVLGIPETDKLTKLDGVSCDGNARPGTERFSSGDRAERTSEPQHLNGIATLTNLTEELSQQLVSRLESVQQENPEDNAPNMKTQRPHLNGDAPTEETQYQGDLDDFILQFTTTYVTSLHPSTLELLANARRGTGGQQSSRVSIGRPGHADAATFRRFIIKYKHLFDGNYENDKGPTKSSLDLIHSVNQVALHLDNEEILQFLEKYSANLTVGIFIQVVKWEVYFFDRTSSGILLSKILQLLCPFYLQFCNTSQAAKKKCVCEDCHSWIDTGCSV